MRVLIYGGRDFHDVKTAFGVLDYVLADWADPGELTIVTGLAAGADTIGRYWACLNDHKIEGYAADWVVHGKAAGGIRNQKMLDSGIDYAVEFPGGKGTADMRARLKKAGVPIWTYKVNEE